MKTQEEIILELVRKHGYVRPSSLETYELPRVALTRLVRAGKLKRQARGLYTLPNHVPGENESLVEVCARYPGAVVCLLSALRYHELTTHAPFEVWIAVGGKARAPQPVYPPVRVVRFSDLLLREGVERHKTSGVEISVTDISRTIADCFRYRNKIGIDVAIEALRDAWSGNRFEMDQLWNYARLCRITSIIRPYMESLV